MKRNISAPGQAIIKAPEPPKTEMREFSEMLEIMVTRMARQYKNQALLALNQGSIDKFADAQAGNFAKIFLKLAKSVVRKLLKTYSDARIEKMVKEATGKVDRRNQKELYDRIEKKIGIPRAELVNSEGLTAQINAITAETVEWTKKLRDESLQSFTTNSLRVMAEGGSLETVLETFDDLVETRKGQAKMVARTQISTFNALTTKARAKNLGITRAIWETAGDERVRRSHLDRDGEEFDISEGLYSSADGKHLIPGLDFNCRCVARLLIPSDEELAAESDE